jgi:hypothetical protein
MMRYLDAMRRGGPVLPGLDDDHVTRALIAAAVFSVAMFVATLPAWLTDARTLDGASVWLKPQKFNVSMTLHFLTLAALAQQLPRRVRAGPTLSFFAYAAIASMAFEIIYISIQAARARRSHFNYETAFETQLYTLMGVGALLLVIVAIVLAVQIARKGDPAAPGLRLGSVLGLSLGAVATIGFAGYMSASGGHHVGLHPLGGATVPLFGWSLETGDMRPAHFVTLHMMQTLPLIGLALDRAGVKATGPVIVAALAQTGLATWLFFQALAGKPFWPF